MTSDRGRAAFSIVCDDMRLEASGKETFVGVYGTHIIVGSIPSVLPQLVICVYAWSDSNDPFEYCEFVISLDDKVIHEIRMPFSEAISEFWTKAPENEGREHSGPEKRVMARLVHRISPFVIESLGTLKMRVRTGTEELRAGSVRIGRPTDFAGLALHPAIHESPVASSNAEEQFVPEAQPEINQKTPE